MSDHYDRYNGMDNLLGTNLASLGTDCISRQAAIEVVSGIDKYFVKYIEQLPAAQPEPQWIPVTEDTPTEDDDYWATFDAETGRFVDWCSWYQGRWVVWTDNTVSEVRNVIAWCKPFEPYKGVTE